MKRRGILLLLLALAAAGAAISIYLVAAHAQTVPLVCSTTSIINCASVIQSPYSVIPGTKVPISAAGIAWFAGSAGLALTGLLATGRRPEPGWLRPLHLGWSAVALAIVLYLVYVELVVLHQICEWCTAVHLLVVATFLLTLSRMQRPAGD